MWPNSAAWVVGSVVVIFAAGLGLATDGAYDYMTRRRPGHFLGIGSSVANIAWRMAMLGLIVGALALQHRSPTTMISSMWSVTRPPAMSSTVAVPLLVALYSIAVLW